jgi:hypothetical protein
MALVEEVLQQLCKRDGLSLEKIRKELDLDREIE